MAARGYNVVEKKGRAVYPYMEKEDLNAHMENGGSAGKKYFFLRMAAFTALFFILFLAASAFFKPAFKRGLYWDWDNAGSNGTLAFYEEPRNTVETLVLGASTAGSYINAPLLYEEYGTNAYNLSIAQQPMLASYFWALEAYRLHSGTLKTIVLDVCAITYPGKDELYRYQISIDSMKLSPLKIKAVSAYTSDRGEGLNEGISHFFPLFSYHDRWKNIKESDFTKFTYKYRDGLRGYEFFTGAFIENEALYEKLYTPPVDLDVTAAPYDIEDDVEKYIYALIDFCREKGINLVFIKGPQSNWNMSSYRNAAQKIAMENGIPYLDFNFEPLISETGFDFSYDTTDGIHSNYYGALKITGYLGRFLEENGLAAGVGHTCSGFMEEEMEKYHVLVTGTMEMIEEKSPAKYMAKALENPANAVLITVKDDAAWLSEDEREGLKDLGLYAFSAINPGNAYIGIIENGSVYELPGNFTFEAYEAYAASGMGEDVLNGLFPPTGTWRNLGGTLVTMSSGGLHSGSVSSCIIEGREYSANGSGINIVVYNTERREIMDSAVFEGGSCG